MKKKSLMILVVIIFQILFLIFTILGDSFFAVISQAKTDYSNVDLIRLEEIKNNPSALAQVSDINVISYDSNESNKILKQLDLIRLCPNIENIYICANGLSLDKDFFNNISSSKDITVSIQWGSINFEGIDNSEIKTLYLSQNIVNNFSSIIDLNNLNWLSLDAVDGFDIIDFDKMENLENLFLNGQRIQNYEEFFSKVKGVKILSLNCCNLQNSDTIFMDTLQNLEELDLYGTYVQDISFLKKLPNLKRITLPLNVDNLDVLYELTKLQKVNFEAVTETKVDNSLIEYFDNNNIEYPLNYDREISKKLQKIISDFNFSDDTSEKEKIEKVTKYVLKNMKCNEEEQWEIYQKEGYVGKTTLDLTVQYGYGVCHDYSILEYTLLTMVGIEAYYIEGYALFSQYDCPAAHAWNMVKVNEDWYGIDALWLDYDDKDQTTSKYENYIWKKYYLKTTKTENLNNWLQNDKEKYMEKCFALEHRTFNDPQDTLKNIKVHTENKQENEANISKDYNTLSEENLSYARIINIIFIFILIMFIIFLFTKK